MESINKLIEWASPRWEKSSTILVIIFLLFLSFIWKFSGSELTELTPFEILFIFSLCFLVYLVWVRAVRLPKCRRKHVGVAIAIAADSEDEYKVMASDFVGTLRRLLNQSGSTHKFFLVEIPQHHASKIETYEDAILMRKKCNCHFMVWGTARLRTIGNKQLHLLNLEGQVTHPVIPEHLQRLFSKEFNELFPRSIRVNRENDVEGLEFTSEWIDCVARYIIGIAALLAGDIDFSQGLFESVLSNQRLKEYPVPAIGKIRRRIPVRLGEIHAFRAGMAYEKWRKKENPELLNEVRMHLSKLAPLDPENYSGRLLRAICFFILDKDVDAAIREVTRCRNVRDATWRYCYAFLLAYKGLLHNAIKMYETAFRHDCWESVPPEIEEFILRVLHQEPEKAQFYFCLGLINWNAKQDKVQAIHDFEAFLDATESSLFPKEQKLAKAYIGNLKGQIRNER
jgi:hypothetical protein